MVGADKGVSFSFGKGIFAKALPPLSSKDGTPTAILSPKPLKNPLAGAPAALPISLAFCNPLGNPVSLCGTLICSGIEREAELKAIGEAGQAKLQEQTGLVHTDTYADTQKKEATLSSSNQFLSDSSQTGDTGTNKMASGVLVRNKEDGKVYFVDGDKKLRYVTDPAFIKGAGVIDVDGSHFQGIEKGANITTKPPFDFKNATEAKALMAETGIQWEQPRGFDTTTGTTPSGLKIGTPESAEELKNLSISSAGRDNAGETILDIAKGEGLPDEIINSEEFNSLSDDQQSLFLAQWTAMNARNEETRANAQEALEQAQQIADPIARIQIAFALDSIPDQFRISKMSIEDRLTSARENIAEIDRLMGDATMEEQQMLNSLKRDFGINAERIEESMAEAGNTYSSKRSDAERYLAQQNLDIRQSRARSFDQQSRNYEKNKAEIERQAELTREAGEAQLKGIVRDAEATLGTEGAKGLDLKGLSGNKISTLGGKKGVPEVGGSIEEQRRASIINLSKTFGESKDPAQLSSLFNL